MRSALLLCLCCADVARYEYLLRRRSEDWFPHISFNPEYWYELSSRDLFRGVKPQKLKTQMILLLLRLIEFSTGRTSSRLLRNQPSDKFSAMQNRSLCGEIFRVSHNTPVSLRSFDPARLSTDLARSVIFQQSPKMNSTDVKKWRTGLTRLLLINPPTHGVSSRDPWMSPALNEKLRSRPLSLMFWSRWLSGKTRKFACLGKEDHSQGFQC